LGFRERLEEIRTGFEPAFWVANLTELFERLAYYGQSTVLAIYLHRNLRFTDTQAGDLTGYFGGVVWFLPILGGTLADRFGFRRSLSVAYLILSIGYFLMGSLSAPWMAPARDALPLYWLVLAVLTVPALGPSIVKPVIVGTTARASTENVRSIGYSIYYTLVNVGGMLGPLMADFVSRRAGVENVFRVSALSVLLMFFAVVLFFKEPGRSGEQQVSSLAQAIRNMLSVIGGRLFLLAAIGLLLKIASLLLHFPVPVWTWLFLLALSLVSLNRFMLFLVIFSGFWVVFWQEFISLPLYIIDYVNPNFRLGLLLTVDPLTVICFQLAVSYLTRKIPSFRAMTLGLLISSVSWLLLMIGTSTWLFVGALVVLAVGEMTQSPRFYEYVSRLAPPGQQGTYMGFAFLPIAIGYLIAGGIGGRLVHHYGEIAHRPRQMWWVISAVGMGTTLLMWVYDKVFAPGRPAPTARDRPTD
jgi:proton-dependent oligopeptide transporter, POT family